LKFLRVVNSTLSLKKMVVERDKIESQITTLPAKILPREKTT